MAGPQIRIFGSVAPVPQAAWEAVRSLLPEGTAEYEDEQLVLDVEEHFVFMDDVLDALVPKLPPDAEGKIEFVDDQEWTLTRYKVDGQTWSSRTFNINDVMDRYNKL